MPLASRCPSQKGSSGLPGLNSRSKPSKSISASTVTRGLYDIIMPPRPRRHLQIEIKPRPESVHRLESVPIPSRSSRKFGGRLRSRRRCSRVGIFVYLKLVTVCHHTCEEWLSVRRRHRICGLTGRRNRRSSVPGRDSPSFAKRETIARECNVEVS